VILESYKGKSSELEGQIEEFKGLEVENDRAKRNLIRRIKELEEEGLGKGVEIEEWGKRFDEAVLEIKGKGVEIGDLMKEFNKVKDALELYKANEREKLAIFGGNSTRELKGDGVKAGAGVRASMEFNERMQYEFEINSMKKQIDSQKREISKLNRQNEKNLKQSIDEGGNIFNFVDSESKGADDDIFARSNNDDQFFRNSSNIHDHYDDRGQKNVMSRSSLEFNRKGRNVARGDYGFQASPAKHNIFSDKIATTKGGFTDEGVQCEIWETFLMEYLILVLKRAGVYEID
jgi:hypothetical protein